jgi:hypothetical protein
MLANVLGKTKSIFQVVYFLFYLLHLFSVISDYMRSELLKHFPNVAIPSESFYANCTFKWEEINIERTNELNIDDLKAISLTILIRIFVKTNYVEN